MPVGARDQRSTLRHPGGAKGAQKADRVEVVAESEDLVVADHKSGPQPKFPVRRPGLRSNALSRRRRRQGNCNRGDNRGPAPCIGAVPQAPPPAVPRKARPDRWFPTRTADGMGRAIGRCAIPPRPPNVSRTCSAPRRAGPARRIARIGPRRPASDLDSLVMPAQKRQDQGLPDDAERRFRFERHGAVREPERDIQRSAPAWLAPSEGETVCTVRPGRRGPEHSLDRRQCALEHLARHQRVCFGRRPCSSRLGDTGRRRPDWPADVVAAGADLRARPVHRPGPRADWSDPPARRTGLRAAGRSVPPKD